MTGAPGPGSQHAQVLAYVDVTCLPSEKTRVAQEIAGDPPETWYISVGNGRGLRVLSTRPTDGVDATVTMTREAFGHLLRGEPVPAGQRPFIRGDRAAVALLKGWLDRAQGL